MGGSPTTLRLPAEMARLLDPQGRLFHGRVISSADVTQRRYEGVRGWDKWATMGDLQGCSLNVCSTEQ